MSPGSLVLGLRGKSDAGFVSAARLECCVCPGMRFGFRVGWDQAAPSPLAEGVRCGCLAGFGRVGRWLDLPRGGGSAVRDGSGPDAGARFLPGEGAVAHGLGAGVGFVLPRALGAATMGVVGLSRRAVGRACR